ncbi:MAG: hypothetical protein MOGMAGMI_01461 [Candidatus Omnitrophica bacterium]|nr:hypothetical protein [Candidatus Omnitrophota bacterium]
MSGAQHPELASGRWSQLTLLEQLGNVGSEVERAVRWKDVDASRKAAERALELMDLTLDDLKNRSRLKEIARAREVLADYFFGGNGYLSTPASLSGYFFPFALAARAGR